MLFMAFHAKFGAKRHFSFEVSDWILVKLLFSYKALIVNFYNVKLIMAAYTTPFDFQGANVMCELCQEENAEFCCTDCQKEMCSRCKTEHQQSKACRNHIVVTSRLDKSITKTRKPIKCSTHSKDIIRMYCTNCDEAICVKCISGIKHKNHIFEELETTLYMYQDEISQSISETKQKIEELQKSLHTIVVNVKDYIEVSDQTINGINQQRKRIKSDVDKIADDLVDQVKKRQEQDLQLMKKEEEDIQKIISDHNKYLQFCEDKLKSMKDFAKIQHQIKLPKSNLPSISQINPPSFVSKTILNLQDMFGKLVQSQKTESTAQKMCKKGKDLKEKAKLDDSVDNTSAAAISTTLVSKINPGIVSKHVSAVNYSEAWCGGYKNLVLLDIHGNVKKKIQLKKDISSVAVTTRGEVFVTELGGQKIRKCLPDGKVINIANTKPYIICGLCYTSVNDNILACLYKSHGDSKVVRMTTTGHIKQTIQKDKHHKSLYKDPWYIAENVNEDIVVVNGLYPCTIVVVNKIGEYRYKYPDLPQSSHPIDVCDGIACDNTGCTLVSDLGNHRLHQIDMYGRFIQFFLTQHDGVHSPRGLSIDNNGQLWLCNNDGKEVIIFKYRS
ncbi:hypothetical protein KUTeg_020103 [Tegillarca granosa]|uniref:B box-type domain-containing protein n=1 Tax=Tegillarca granosa TaxID=220873 RepID=A0ABQ9E6T6_TEGGR|nr:hypothetical protein KUTeg_020103 [Tegillarca granosa]